jgi:hypothetical protein
MIEKTDLPKPGPDAAANIVLHGAFGMVAQGRMDVVVEHG